MVISIQLGDGWSLIIETDTIWLFRYMGDGWSLMIETDTWLFRYSWVMYGV